MHVKIWNNLFCCYFKEQSTYSYPSAFIVEMIFSESTFSPSMYAMPSDSSTCTERTPSIAASAFSTLALQWLHIMPFILNFCCVIISFFLLNFNIKPAISNATKIVLDAVCHHGVVALQQPAICLWVMLLNHSAGRA